jgi:hypothetical protein
VFSEDCRRQSFAGIRGAADLLRQRKSIGIQEGPTA